MRGKTGPRVPGGAHHALIWRGEVSLASGHHRPAWHLVEREDARGTSATLERRRAGAMR